MNFADYTFWKTLIVTFLSLSALRLLFIGYKREAWLSVFDKCAFTILAVTLLVTESPVTLAVFLWVVALGWLALCCLSLENGRVLKFGFGTMLLLQLAPLFYYKYWGFFFNEVLGLNWIVPGALIPMGLSFYTFQVISFCVDSRKLELEKPRLLDFLNFCSFFPQIVAGPIERRENLLSQVEKFHFKIHLEQLDGALRWIILGLFYKIVFADNLGIAVDRMSVDATNAYQVWLEAFTFSWRIYFDFAGYSFVALGLGRLFGVKLTLNFESPYLAGNLQVFWRRWHITLSSWLRDYVYIPLGGSRRGNMTLNVLIVFVVSGIWHGAGWGFLIWGALHGFGILLISRLKWSLPFVISCAINFVFVTFTWIFFYESSIDEMFAKVGGILGKGSYGLSSLLDIPSAFLSRAELVTFGFVLLLCFLTTFLEIYDQVKKRNFYQSLRSTPLVLIQVALIVLIGAKKTPGFIYFNF